MNALIYENARLGRNWAGADELGKFLAKHSDNVAEGNRRNLLRVEAMHITRQLAGDHPTGARMQALRLVDWLLQTLVNEQQPNEATAQIIEAMTGVVHSENVDKQDRYVIACRCIDDAAEAYNQATTDAGRGAAVVFLAYQLYGLDRKFGAYMVLSAAATESERLAGNRRLEHWLSTWHPKPQGLAGRHSSTGLLAALLVETGAFDTIQTDTSTPKGKEYLLSVRKIIQNSVAKSK